MTKRQDILCTDGFRRVPAGLRGLLKVCRIPLGVETGHATFSSGLVPFIGDSIGSVTACQGVPQRTKRGVSGPTMATFPGGRSEAFTFLWPVRQDMPTPVRQRLADWSTKEIWVISANGFFLYPWHLDVQKQAIKHKNQRFWNQINLCWNPNSWASQR